MFGRKARKINELQAKLTGKDIDLRAALKARASLEGNVQAQNEAYEGLRLKYDAVLSTNDKLTTAVAGLSSERDQLSAKVEELEQEVEDLKAENFELQNEAGRDESPEKLRENAEKVSGISAEVRGEAGEPERMVPRYKKDYNDPDRY